MERHHDRQRHDESLPVLLGLGGYHDVDAALHAMTLTVTKPYDSWGRYPQSAPAMAVPLHWRSESPFDRRFDTPVLAYGQGRSYGDACLNNGGVLLDTAGLSRLMHFDRERGLLRCESGTTCGEILRTIVPAGWFLPVTPGTKFVSIGGAIANDVHGKNHHRAGTFGCHVTQFELLRSDGERLLCSPTENAEMFAATIGGLGLTGLIVWAEFRLQKIAGPMIDMEWIRFGSLEEFLTLSEESDARFDYSASWMDCLASGRGLGRGVMFRGNHASTPDGAVRSAGPLARVPCDMPSLLLNRLTMKAFNTAYYRSRIRSRASTVIDYDRFFYPLDRLLEWNRLYGKSGFLQYQCVMPAGSDLLRSTTALLARIAGAGTGSFLAVLKTFGAVRSPGLMSFPRPGITLALDFPFHGRDTLTFLESLDRLVAACGGAVYPAKDARMSADSFRRFFPQHQAFRAFVDTQFSSDFWRRVSAQ
jgi:FAD/FMN-containing dehydrogenase